MTNPRNSGDVPIIDLLGGQRLTDSATPTLVPAEAETMADMRMTLDRLGRHYRAILRAQAIYYPVAFQFQRELGRGRQGIVFLALRQGARGCITEHAIKLLDPQIYRTAQEYWTDMGRIASQISRLQKLPGPNIVARHSYEETHGIGYVQMDVVDGCDLMLFMERAHLDLARRRSTPREWARFTETIFRVEKDQMCLQPGVAIHVLRGILRGLESVHSGGFLHFDIKPSNIMIDRLGYAKLIDFGRAVLIGEELTFLLGSPMYMAPETHRRQPGDARTDLYSVGLVGIEMLRGRRIVQNDNISEADLLAIKMELPRRLGQLLPAYVLKNEVLVSILRRLIDPDPARRFASAKEAESGSEGLAVIDKQLVQVGLDSQYSRDLADYLEKLVDPRTGRIEFGPPATP